MRKPFVKELSLSANIVKGSAPTPKITRVFHGKNASFLFVSLWIHCGIQLNLSL